MQFGADLASKLEVSYFLSCEWTFVQVRANPGLYKTIFTIPSDYTSQFNLHNKGVCVCVCVGVCVCGGVRPE